MLAGQRKKGARGRRAGRGLPHEQDAAVQRWVGEAESDQPGGTVQPGRGQDRHAQLLGRQLDHYAQVAGLSGDPGGKAGGMAGAGDDAPVPGLASSLVGVWGAGRLWRSGRYKA
jgi:hypothetical protein